MPAPPPSWRPQGATWRVGSGKETAWIRYYAEMRDLIGTLQRAGFDTWVISASPQEWADAWGRGVGIDRAHTIGIRTVKRHGRITPHLKGCGGPRARADSVMTYIDGKRCWINQGILDIRGPAALEPAPADRRQALAGGDADTDVTMVRDATGAHVVINRNKPELMCRAFRRPGRQVGRELDVHRAAAAVRGGLPVLDDRGVRRGRRRDPRGGRRRAP